MTPAPQKMKAYEPFAAWRSDQTLTHQHLIDALTAVIAGVAPHLSTTVKWGQGCWTDDGTPKVYIHAEPDHLQLGFYRGSLLEDPQGLLEGKGTFVRHVKVHHEADVKQAGLRELIFQATV